MFISGILLVVAWVQHTGTGSDIGTNSPRARVGVKLGVVGGIGSYEENIPYYVKLPKQSIARTAALLIRLTNVKVESDI